MCHTVDRHRDRCRGTSLCREGVDVGIGLVGVGAVGGVSEEAAIDRPVAGRGWRVASS